MSRRPPNRYSKQFLHNEYGIKVWFSRIGITDAKIQDGLIEWFLSDFGFKGNAYNAKVAFIQNRWDKFTQYVQKNHKFYLESLYN